MRPFSVDAIEKQTGMDFFSDLDDQMEDKLEAEVPKEMWWGSAQKASSHLLAPLQPDSGIGCGAENACKTIDSWEDEEGVPCGDCGPTSSVDYRLKRAAADPQTDALAIKGAT